MSKDLFIVASYTGTVPGRLIRFRASLKFWNRYKGDGFSHISLSRDSKLGNMMSIARKEVHNPFNAGLVIENIRDGMFALNPSSEIAVMKLPVTEKQYSMVSQLMDDYWEHRDMYGYNFLGLTSMLVSGRGIACHNKFFCSEWVATVLRDSQIELFDGKKPKDVRPFDFYGQLQDNIVYEGLATQYPEYGDPIISSISSNPSSDFSKPKILRHTLGHADVRR